MGRVEDDETALLGSSSVARREIKVGTGIEIERTGDQNIRLLQNADKDELLVHLRSQTAGLSVREHGGGAVNRMIIFLRMRLEDDFGMDDSAIEKALSELK